MQRRWWNDGKVNGSYTDRGDPIFELLGDDAGLTTFLVEAQREVDDGRHVSTMLAYSALWLRLPEGWRITYAHESSNK